MYICLFVCVRMCVSGYNPTLSPSLLPSGISGGCPRCTSARRRSCCRLGLGLTLTRDIYRLGLTRVNPRRGAQAIALTLTPAHLSESSCRALTLSVSHPPLRYLRWLPEVHERAPALECQGLG